MKEVSQLVGLAGVYTTYSLSLSHTHTHTHTAVCLSVSLSLSPSPSPSLPPSLPPPSLPPSPPPPPPPPPPISSWDRGSWRIHLLWVCSSTTPQPNLTLRRQVTAGELCGACGVGSWHNLVSCSSVEMDMSEADESGRWLSGSVHTHTLFLSLSNTHTHTHTHTHNLFPYVGSY